MASNEDRNLESFGSTADRLSQNPLGIIALFIVLVYGFASLVVGLGRNLTEETIYILVWFMVLFPVLVLSVFFWLVSRHHTKLYAPKDYRQEKHFIQALSHNVGKLRAIPSQQPKSEVVAELPGTEISPLALDKQEPSTFNEEKKMARLSSPVERNNEREQIYKGNRYLFLVHVLTPSNKDRQEFDIFIYAKRHGDKEISDVVKAEFFFGKYWGNQIFTGTREGDIIGVSTSAYGSFLCTCLVTFEDGEQVLLYRYIDFEMGEVVKKLLQKSKAT